MAERQERYIREVFDGNSALLPELPACGWSDQRAARVGLPPHEHPDAFEICLLSRGEVDWWVADRVFTIREGQVYLTRPGERHGGIDSMMHPCELYWFQLARDSEPELEHDLAALPVRTFTASAELQHLIQAVVDEHRRPSPHAVVAARATLQLALVMLIREGSSAHAHEVSEPVRHALAWMAKRVEQHYGVPDVAAAVGLSTVRLQTRFQRELACSIGEHRNRLRLHAAKLKLRDTDDEITAIAHQLSFSSSQYFATFFRQRVGVPPTTFRDQQRHVPSGTTSR